jgi:hypothetical protein
MKCEISIQFECGEKTCAMEKGMFCHMFIGGMSGQCQCELYGYLDDKDGWVQRHPDCLRDAKGI